MAKQSVLKYLLASLAAFAILGSAGAAQSAHYIDYWGDDLFYGMAYHRFGCYDDDNYTLSSQDYDGFTDNRYCFAGRPWDAPGDAGYVYLDWNYTTGKSQLDSCGAHANDKYGTPNYAPRSNTCEYNIWEDCNSDCWIRAFSRCQGYEIEIYSPCW